MPPNTQSFDPEKCRSSLVPNRLSQSNPQSEAASLTSFLGTLTNLITAVVPATPATPCTSHLPQTPTCNSGQELPSSSPTAPTVPSPSQLTHYLIHAENFLGVRHASTYEDILSKENYGPDILSEVPDTALTASPVSMPRGDTIQLKRGCQDWLKLESKRHCYHVGSVSSQTHAGPSSNHNSNSPPKPSSPPKSNVEVQYSVEFPGRGGAHYFGLPMKKAEPTEADTHMTYFNDALNIWLPVPPGFTAPPYSSEGREGQVQWPLVRPIPWTQT